MPVKLLPHPEVRRTRKIERKQPSPEVNSPEKAVFCRNSKGRKKKNRYFKIIVR